MGFPAIRVSDGRELATLIRDETFALAHAVSGARVLVTHIHADRDALASLVLGQLYRESQSMPFAEIAFVPGSVKDFAKDRLALDIGDARGLRSTPRGGYMIKASSAGGSCCMAMLRLLPEYERSLLYSYIAEISISDEYGRSTAIRMSTKYNIVDEDDRRALTSTNSAFLFQAQRRVLNDNRLYDNIWAEIIGILQMGDERRSALSIKDPWKDVLTQFNGRFAVLPVGASLNHAQLLEILGVEVTVHARALDASNERWSLGFHRARSVSPALDFEKMFGFLQQDFPSICVKPFFVGWGSKGGGLRCSAADMMAIREKLLMHLEMHLGPWYRALRH